jgi:diguanylate cyclase (GGDEF)-like protein
MSGDSAQDKDRRPNLEELVRNPKIFLSSRDDKSWKDVGLEVAEKSFRPDLRFGSDHLVKVLVDFFRLDFAGVYINNLLNISVEYDHDSERTVYDRTAELSPELANVRLPVMLGSSRLLIPLRHRGKYFGVSIFDRDDFSDHDIAALAYCVKLFSNHINTARRIYILQKEVETDYLTGIFSRMKFDQDYRQFLRQARRLGQPLSVMMADIDHFKKVNDTYGHAYGDYVLRTVAQIIKNSVRDGLVYRYGGEEIVVLLPNTSLQSARVAARRMNDAVRKYHFDDPQAIGSEKRAAKVYCGRRNSHAIRLSGGVASSDTKGRGRVRDLLLTADDNLYKAKKFRDSIFSGEDDDYLTGLPEIDKFESYLKTQISQCNRGSGSLAYFMFDVVGFTNLVNTVGGEAWSRLVAAARMLNGDDSEFDFVARVCDSDKFLAALYMDDDAEACAQHAGALGLRSLGHLRKYLNFVCGVAVYSPDLVGAEHGRTLAENPEMLQKFVENLCLEAGNGDKTLVMDLYKH